MCTDSHCSAFSLVSLPTSVSSAFAFAMPPSASSSSSSSSDDEPDAQMVAAQASRTSVCKAFFADGSSNYKPYYICQFMCNPAQGESSEEDADQPSSVKTRAMCGQFVWPCPREFPADPAVRKARNFLIPEDVSKETLGQTFKAVLAKHNQLVNLDRLHIFDEPHKKFNAATGLRARHYHIIFRFKAVFAHLQIAKSLREKGLPGLSAILLAAFGPQAASRS